MEHGDVFGYKPDHRGTGHLMRTPEMHGAVELAAYEAVPFAKGISPDAPPYGEGYIASFVVDGRHLEKINGTRRATTYLRNTQEYATAVELGQTGDASRADTGHHVLARTADHIERG